MLLQEVLKKPKRTIIEIDKLIKKSTPQNRQGLDYSMGFDSSNAYELVSPYCK